MGRTLAVMILAVVLSVLARAMLGCSRAAPELQRFEFSRLAMGVAFRISMYAEEPREARAAAEKAFERVSEIESLCSHFDPDSELMRLCREAGGGRALRSGPELFHLLVLARELARESGGAFDFTLGPLSDLWRQARREPRLPETGALEAARAKVGWEKVELDAEARTVRFAVEGMRPDLGGIAKGYAVDEALLALERAGIRSALVEAGGDLAASEAPPGAAGWTIAIADPSRAGGVLAPRLVLRRAALATSGERWQHLEIDGRRYSHVLDPRTGLAVEGRRSATVLAPTCARADALATALCVLPPGRGLELVDGLEGTAAWIWTGEGNEPRLLRSRGCQRVDAETGPERAQ